MKTTWDLHHPLFVSADSPFLDTLQSRCLSVFKTPLLHRSPHASELGQLKACVHTDGIAKLVAQDALLAVVGQLEQVEACGGSRKSTTRLLLSNGEKAPEDTSKGVSSVLDTAREMKNHFCSLEHSQRKGFPCSYEKMIFFDKQTYF